MSFGKEEEVKREERRRAKIAAEVTEDFERRREERRQTESGWLLNMNFFSGNQYCDVSPYGGIVEEDKRFYWQSRRVFNHIAPTIDSRIAKLTKMRPALKVRPFSDEEADVKTARLASGILDYVRERIRLDETTARGTLWSETCGRSYGTKRAGGRWPSMRGARPSMRGKCASASFRRLKFSPIAWARNALGK